MFEKFIKNCCLLFFHYNGRKDQVSIVCFWQQEMGKKLYTNYYWNWKFLIKIFCSYFNIFAQLIKWKTDGEICFLKGEAECNRKCQNAVSSNFTLNNIVDSKLKDNKIVLIWKKFIKKKNNYSNNSWHCDGTPHMAIWESNPKPKFLNSILTFLLS